VSVKSKKKISCPLKRDEKHLKKKALTSAPMTRLTPFDGDEEGSLIGLFDGDWLGLDVGIS